MPRASPLQPPLFPGPEEGRRTLVEQLAARRPGLLGSARTLAQRLGFERLLWQAGVERVAGVDESGMGPLAGPVVAAAVVLPREIRLRGVDDSKRLEAAERERLAAAIGRQALASSIVSIEVDELDRLNIYQAGLEAMRRAVLSLPLRPAHLLVDARRIPGLGALPQNAILKGDARVYSIACASILAKVHRDAIMERMAREYPGYGFERHKGYATSAHLDALRRLGPCPQHRRSFRVLEQILGGAHDSFYALREAVDLARSAANIDELGARIRALRTTVDSRDVAKLGTLLNRRRRRIARKTDGKGGAD